MHTFLLHPGWTMGVGANVLPNSETNPTMPYDTRLDNMSTISQHVQKMSELLNSTKFKIVSILRTVLTCLVLV